MSEKPTTAAGEEQKSVSLFWHALDAPEVLNSLNVAAEAGLTSEEAEKRLAHYGPNELVEKSAPLSYKCFGRKSTALSSGC